MGYLELLENEIEKGLNISQAMRLLEKNIKVAREAWISYLIKNPEHCTIAICNLDNEIIAEWFPTLEDLTANDWRIV